MLVRRRILATIMAVLLAVTTLPLGGGRTSYADNEQPAIEILGSFDMGTLTMGYTKEAAQALRKSVIVRNNSRQDIVLNGYRVSFYGLSRSEFKYNKSIGTDDVTIEPGEELSLGWVQPQHQMGAGTYTGDISVWSYLDDEETVSDYVTVKYKVESSGTDMFISDEEDEAVEELNYGTGLVGAAEIDGDTFNITNIGSTNYKLKLDSNSKLFDFGFVDEEDAEKQFAPGKTAEVQVALNANYANTLKAGNHNSKLTVTAVSADGSESVEKVIPVKYKLCDLPAWEHEEYEETVKPDDYWGYFRLKVINTDCFDRINDYLTVVLEEGEEYFELDSSISYSGTVSLSAKEDLPEGEYTAEVGLLYDSTGKADFRHAKELDTCTFTLTVQGDSDYNIEIGNKYGDTKLIYLGILTEGYASDSHRKTVAVKNTGEKALYMSPAGASIDVQESYDPGAFEVSTSAETTTVGTGGIYEQAWVQPVAGKGPGIYRAELVFTDNDAKASDRVDVVYIVGKQGLNFNLEEWHLFEPNQPVDLEKGLDFGADKPNLPAKTTTRYVDVINTGNVPFTMDAAKVDGGSDAFTVELIDGGKIEPGDEGSVRVRLNTESIAGTEGDYTATVRINIVNANDDTVKRTVEFPLKYAVTPNAVATVTLDFQGKGNSEYENTALEFKKGTGYNTVKNELVAKATGQDPLYSVQWPTDNDYTVVGFTDKPDSEYTTWEQLRDNQQELQNNYTVTGNKTFYVNWAQKINKVDLTVAVPKCGEEIATPDVTAPETGAHYTLDPDNSYWYTAQGEAYFKADKDYDVNIALRCEFGYSFSKDCEIRINGKKGKKLTEDNLVSAMRAGSAIRATDHRYEDAYTPVSDEMHKRVCSECGDILREEHVWDDGEITIVPTCEDPGKKVYTCLRCGWEKSVILEPQGHSYETRLIKPTSDDEYGIMGYECKTCGETDTAWFGYACTDGDGSVWYTGSNRSVPFTFERFPSIYPHENCFREIKIDDTIYPVDEYGYTTFNEVITEIRLPTSILEKLSVGEHTLTMLYEDGWATAKFSVKEAKVIDTVDLTIKPPVCGEEASNQWNERKGEVIVNPPQVSFGENADYKQGTLFRNHWTDANSSQYWSGTFKGGETQYAYVYLEPKEGAVFKLQESESSYNPVYAGVVKVNGQMVVPVKATAYVDGVRFLLPIKAEHVWDAGKETKAPTTTAEGEKMYTCTVCGDTKTEAIPKSGTDPTQMGEDGTALGKGASAAAANNAILGMTSDADPAGSKCAPLLLKATKSTRKAVTLGWKKVTGANKYVVYGNACGKKYKMKKLATVTGNKKKVSKISKKLKKATYYKFIVVALDENNNVVSTSKVVHASTAGSKKKANPKAVKVTKPKKAKATVAVGKTAKIKAKVTKAGGAKVKKHRALSYESRNPAVATVSAKGVITGVKKGSTTVYVYAQNGSYKAVKVTVK